MPRPPEWTEKAACDGVDTELFFPMPNDTDGIARAKWWCRRCEVKDECLRFGLDMGHQHGVYGGMSEKERTVMKREINKGNFVL